MDPAVPLSLNTLDFPLWATLLNLDSGFEFWKAVVEVSHKPLSPPQRERHAGG